MCSDLRVPASVSESEKLSTNHMQRYRADSVSVVEDCECLHANQSTIASFPHPCCTSVCITSRGSTSHGSRQGVTMKKDGYWSFI